MGNSEICFLQNQSTDDSAHNLTYFGALDQRIKSQKTLGLVAFKNIAIFLCSSNNST